MKKEFNQSIGNKMECNWKLNGNNFPFSFCNLQAKKKY